MKLTTKIDNTIINQTADKVVIIAKKIDIEGEATNVIRKINELPEIHDGTTGINLMGEVKLEEGADGEC